MMGRSCVGLLFWTGLLLLVTANWHSWCQAASGACVGQQRRYEETMGTSTEFPYPLRYGFRKDYKVLRFADWDGDQDADVLMLRMPVKNEQLRLYLYEQMKSLSYMTEHFFGLIDISRGPASIDVADWNDDGQLDLLVCTSVGANLTIGWLNGSALPLQDHLDLKPEYGEVILRAEGSSCEMHAVDFDEDGDLDLILGEFSRAVINRSFPVPRYFERVAGELVERTGTQNPLTPFGGMIYAIGDVDGDGRLDVVLKGAEVCRYPFYMSDCTTDFRYFERAADGSFFEPLDNPFKHGQLWQVIYDDMTEEEKYNDYHVADWNGDGMPDIIEVGYRWGSKVHQHVVDPGLAYSPRVSRYGDIELQREFGSLKLADFNGDGLLDVLFDDELSIFLYESHGSGFREVLGAFENVTSVQSRSKLFRVAISDWDGDGDVDLLVATQDGKMHYHEMIQGSWHPEAQHPFSNVTLETTGGRPPHLIMVDWNFDGKMDLVLGSQDGRIFEQQEDGSLRQKPESPFARWVGKSADLNEEWRFLDCNGDSALDMLRLVYTGSETANLLQICLQGDQDFECRTDFECLGTNIKSLPHEITVRNLGDITSFDVEHVADGLNLLTSHRNRKQPLLWTAGYCEPQEPCGHTGSCMPGQVECSCIAGYELVDCSGCETFFHSTPAELGKLHDCKACPGASGQVCHGRGRCFDDAVAKALPQTSTAALMARGNGSCLCNEDGFSGWDESGRSTCVDGHCPAGTEEVAGTCRHCASGSWAAAGALCKKCGPGTFSVEGSSNCSSCPGGSISAAGAAACLPCPAGKYEKDFLTCVDCSPGFISSSGQISCAKCGAGTHAPRAGSTACELCEAGSFATEGSAACRPCPAGTISGAGSGMCSPCGAGTISAASGSSACEMCPAGTYSKNGAAMCRACPAGTISGAASAFCSECPDGSVAEGSVSCEDCPGGTFAENYKCHPCPLGQVSSPSSVSCRPCAGFLLRYTPNDAKQECQVELGEIALALALLISSALLMLFLLNGVLGGLPISDLSAQGQSFVVTTSRAHCLLRCEPIVTFSQTGVPHLEASAWRVRRLSRYQLTLCCDKEDIAPLDTSMGFLHLRFPRAFVFTGHWHCPLVCWCLLFLAAVIAIVSQLTWALASAVCGVGICAGSLWFAFQRRQGFQFLFQVPGAMDFFKKVLA